MFNKVDKLKEKNELQKIMTEYFKQDSKRPDFLETLPAKLASDKREKVDTSYLLAIAGIISNIDNDKQKLCLLEKLVEELVLIVVRLSK